MVVVERAKQFVKRDYIYVAMDVRGRGDSDGDFTPYFNEGRDGFDAIEWCARQEWSDGNVGTYGGAHLGRPPRRGAPRKPPPLPANVGLGAPPRPFVLTLTQVSTPIPHAR